MPWRLADGKSPIFEALEFPFLPVIYISDHFRFDIKHSCNLKMTSNYNTTNTTTGYDDPAGTHGPHHSAVGNAMDPRVDSDRDGRALGKDAVNNPGAPGTESVQTAGSSRTPVEPHSGTGGGFVESIKGRMAQAHVR